MSSPQRQEETPLLFLFLDDAVSSPSRGPVLENNARYHRITSGVSSVFTQWPGHITTCCLAACAFFVFLCTFLAVITAHLHPVSFAPHCSARNQNIQNRTQIYIVHMGNSWDPRQLRTIEDVIANYPAIPIDLLQLWNGTGPTIKTPFLFTPLSGPNERFKRVADNYNERPLQFDDDEFDINIGVDDMPRNTHKGTLDETDSPGHLYSLPLIVTLDSLLKQYPIIYYHTEELSEFFAGTPFAGMWTVFDEPKVELAARVLPLWNKGGISMRLPKYNISQENFPRFGAGGKISFEVESFIRGNLSTYRRMPEGIVNIDDEVLHMETKTSCHAFLGEIIKNLRHAHRSTSVKSIIDSTLKVFCLNHDVADKFCNRFLNKTYKSL